MRLELLGIQTISIPISTLVSSNIWIFVYIYSDSMSRIRTLHKLKYLDSLEISFHIMYTTYLNIIHKP
jgi:hypothetical protein